MEVKNSAQNEHEPDEEAYDVNRAVGEGEITIDNDEDVDKTDVLERGQADSAVSGRKVSLASEDWDTGEDYVDCEEEMIGEQTQHPTTPPPICQEEEEGEREIEEAGDVEEAGMWDNRKELPDLGSAAGLAHDYHYHPCERRDVNPNDDDDSGSPFDSDAELDEPVTDDDFDDEDDEATAPEVSIVSDYSPLKLDGKVLQTEFGRPVMRYTTFTECGVTRLQTLSERSRLYKQRLERQEASRKQQMRIMRKTHEAHLAEKQLLVRNLEDLIEEQEAKINSLEQQRKTGKLFILFLINML